MAYDAKVRFSFGENWKNFSSLIDRDRIEIAKTSLKEMFGCDNLKNKTFLDAGCGSGLFSLAAKELGAEVFSFDFDENSVTTTQLLKANSRSTIEGWTIERGSLLDQAFIARIGQYDCVYCWGGCSPYGSNVVGAV